MVHSLPSEDASLSVFSRINPTVDKVLPPEIKLAAYRVIQESVNNAVRHSDADSIVIRLALNDQGLSFEVSDDGSGLDPASGRQEGDSGLTLMREYIDAVGGRLDIRSTPGRGTRVSATIPVITS
jgi:signal transduction histidine kinase